MHIHGAARTSANLAIDTLNTIKQNCLFRISRGAFFTRVIKSLDFYTLAVTGPCECQ